MNRNASLLRGRRFVVSFLFFGTALINDGFCGQSTIRVMVRGVDRPSAEERLAIFEEAKTGEETGGLINTLLSKFKQQDLSNIEVTLRNDFLPQKITKRTDKNGEVLFENIPTVEGNELTAKCDVLINGQPVKAKARTFTQSGVVSLKLYADWVTLKGKVLDADGKPLGGVHVKVLPMPSEYPFSEFTRMYPPQTAVSDTNGVYELPDVRPLNMKTTACYLVSSNAAVRSVAYFKGEIYAGRTEVTYGENPLCFALPLISENMLHRARLYNSALGKQTSKSAEKPGWVEQQGIFLPESKGDVIFLPDIIMGSIIDDCFSQPMDACTATPPDHAE